MILGFMQRFPWKGEDKLPVPTNFREKILAPYYEDQPNPIIWNYKLHTFREDPHDRWKAGRKLDMVYRGVGYKILDHFNKDIPELSKCVSTQEIRFEFNYKITDGCVPCGIYIDDIIYWRGFIHGNWANSCYSQEDSNKIETLAKNDGFSDSVQFFKWFKKDWKGKIIHWTDLRY